MSVISPQRERVPGGQKPRERQGRHRQPCNPFVREGPPIGNNLVRRMEVRPFYDQQIALLETFAAQAAIVIENVRLFESGKQRRCLAASSVWTAMRAIANCGWSRYAALTV